MRSTTILGTALLLVASLWQRSLAETTAAPSIVGLSSSSSSEGIPHSHNHHQQSLGQSSKTTHLSLDKNAPLPASSSSTRQDHHRPEPEPLSISSYSPATTTTTTTTKHNTHHSPPLFYEMPQVTEKDIRVASGVAAGVCGTLLLGPLAGTCLGFGAAYAASQKHDDDNNFWTDAARAWGEVALLAHMRAQAIDEKYHVVEQSLVAVQGAWEKVRSWSHHPNTSNATPQQSSPTEKVVSCCLSSAHKLCVHPGLSTSANRAGLWLGHSLDRALAERRGLSRRRHERIESLTAQR